MFGHERFEAYQISIKFLKVAIYLADKKRFYAIAQGSVLKAQRWNALLFVMF
jgi:hypothetical protein